jgi:hypothetical protein
MIALFFPLGIPVEASILVALRTYNTVIPGSQSFFFQYPNTSVVRKYRFSGSNLKYNCLWFIHIKVVKSTAINH